MIAVPFTVFGLALLVELGFRRGTAAPISMVPIRWRRFRAMPADPVAIARDLIRCRSVTPEEGGALAYLHDVLAKAGFAVHRMTFAEPGTAPIENLYARIGTESPI